MAHDCVIELMEAELDPDRNDDDGFYEAAKHFMSRVGAEASDEASRFVERYLIALKSGHDSLLDCMRTDQLDNYLIASYAAGLLKQQGVIDANVPLIPWAARNKREYMGLRGEIANLRLLILFGFDVNAQNPSTGATALHYMSNLEWTTGPHPRAMQMLLQAGADPNIRNENGDNVLAYMAGNMPFRPMAQAFIDCISFGGDVHSVSNDGMSILDILKACQQQAPESTRQMVIEQIELSSIARKQKSAKQRRL